MKLDITPPPPFCSTMFGVFLMGTAASAHGALLSYSCFWFLVVDK